MKDQELIRKIRSGTVSERSQALKNITDSYYQKVQSYIFARGGDDDTSMDVFQDGMIALYQSINSGRFRGESSLFTYLFAICKNLWMERERKRNTEKKHLNVLKGDNFLDADATINTELLKSVFSELKEDCQKVLTLFYYKKKSIRALQQELNVNSEQVVKNKKARCLKYLMNIIAKRGVTKDMFFHE